MKLLIFLSTIGFVSCSCDNLTNRLPKDVIPRNYNLWLHPNITTGEVKASVTIDITVDSPTSRIVLHAKNLTLDSYYITYYKQEVKATFARCDEYDYWIFNLGKGVVKGDRLVLTIKYNFKISHELSGLHYTTHGSANGVNKTSIVTHFEPNNARKMLPCFDEPNFKARFGVLVVRNESHTALSNMRLHRSEDFFDGLKMDRFQITPEMSTYLLAIAVLDGYKSKEIIQARTRKPTLVRVFAPADLIEDAEMIEDGDLGFNITMRALEYFEKYTNVTFPLEKLDAISVDQFSADAMENWGLMMFRPSRLFPIRNKSNRLSVALTVCQMVAHQWFGNLVTMDWWDDLYLNEGIASHLKYKCVENLFPHANFTFGVRRRVESDNLTRSNNDLLDYFPYRKSPAIINMVSEIVGESNFQMAMREYLKNNLYSNTKSVDVWSVVEKYSKDYYTGPVSLQSFVHGWNTMAGHPVVRFEVKNGIATVYNQTKFSMTGSGEASNLTIPLFYRTNESEERKLEWMGPEGKNVSWSVGSADWVILNTGGIAPIKVLYDEDMYKKLGDQLMEDQTQISDVDRYVLLADPFYLAEANYLDKDVYQNLVRYHESNKM